MSSNAIPNINNLNVLTFIKDIYLSLKHIDQCFNSFKENINSRITKIEDTQQTILEKINGLEILLSTINDKTKETVSLDKKLEIELMEKMKKLNNTELTIQDKLELKPHELTFGNILENNYTILDINHTLKNNPLLATNNPAPVEANNLYNMIDNMIDNNLVENNNENNKKETLNDLLF